MFYDRALNTCDWKGLKEPTERDQRQTIMCHRPVEKGGISYVHCISNKGYSLKDLKSSAKN